MSLLTVGVVLMVIDGYGYLTQTPSKLSGTGQRREGKSLARPSAATKVVYRARILRLTRSRRRRRFRAPRAIRAVAFGFGLNEFWLRLGRAKLFVFLRCRFVLVTGVRE